MLLGKTNLSPDVPTPAARSEGSGRAAARAGSKEKMPRGIGATTEWAQRATKTDLLALIGEASRELALRAEATRR